MATANGPAPRPAESLSQRLERFEQAWEHGPRPAIADYLPDGPERRPALVELVHVDLERRLKAGEPARVEEYLTRFPELADDAPAVLDLIAAEYRLRCGRQPGLATDEYRRRFPQFEADLSTRLRPDAGPATPPASARDDDATPSDRPGTAGADAVGTPTSAGQRFRILRPHARGGLGEVFVARDEELHREVALKEIQGKYADQPHSRARFLLEAEVTGGLEHPGVVPVYGLGRHADGRPYYAMRFIKGDSLKDAVERFHREEETLPPGERALRLRQLLGRFVDVCNAIAYAHSRGVLHRDLKPANVMLGPYGETLVVDWGLAKVLGGGGETDSAEGPLRPASADGPAPTQAGAVVGTPAYMSPEQAEGDPDRLGPASDVYSLGATLHALLTGRPPFEGGPADVLRRVRRGAPTPPRQVHPGVPAALEAVCLKAMARRPEDRYPSAQALAADVERFLADEPVSAYPEPVVQRLGRWGRRHRTAVASAAALLVTAVVGLAAGLVAVNAERQRTERARAAEAKRRQQAREALDAMASQVIEDWLTSQKALTEPQKKFLEKALASYEDFAQDTGQDPEARAGVAKAYLRVGVIRARLGQLVPAEAAFRTSAELYRKLAEEYPAVPGYRHDLAATHGNLAHLLHRTGRGEPAEGELRAALKIAERLAEDFPAEPDYRNELARHHTNLGNLLEGTRRLQEAEAEFRTALALRQKLAGDFPAVPAYRQELAISHNNLGILYRGTGRIPEAVEAFRQARDIQQRLADERPQEPAYRWELSVSRNNLGNMLQGSGRRPEGEQEFRQALVLQQRLAEDYPSVPEYRRGLAETHDDLGLLLMNAGRYPEAGEEYRAARALFRRLADEHPDEPDYRQDLAVAHNNLGTLHESLKEGAEAEAEYRAALALQKKLAADFPDDPTRQNEVAGTLVNLGRLLQVRKDFAGSRKALEEALPYHEAALKANPRHPAYRLFFRNNAWVLTETLLGLGDHAAAADRAETLARSAVAPALDRYNAACFLARCVPLAGKDTQLPEARRKELATGYADRAMAALRQAVAGGYKDAAHLKKDPDLEPLRPRDDFGKLVAELEKNAPARPDRPRP